MEKVNNLKRHRPEKEQNSQELPEKKKNVEELDSSNSLLRPSQMNTPKPSFGLFRQSKLAAPDVTKTQQLLKEKIDQETKDKGPLVLKDPSTDYHPAGDNSAKQLTVKLTSSVRELTSANASSTFGSFGEAAKNGEAENNGNHEKVPEITSNPFGKLAGNATTGFGFGSIKRENDNSDDTVATSNPFKRLADTTESNWSGLKKEKTEIKTEPVEEKPDNPEKTDEKKPEILTGEEEEKNVLQITSKLFQFEPETQTYSERGRGILRMNDRGEGIHFGSRLVFRTTGTQRVALNTKLWSGMSVEQVSQKSVRISAQDQSTQMDKDNAPGVGIFLLQSNVADSKELFKAIDSRILQMKQNASERGEETSIGANGKS